MPPRKYFTEEAKKQGRREADKRRRSTDESKAKQAAYSKKKNELRKLDPEAVKAHNQSVRDWRRAQLANPETRHKRLIAECRVVWKRIGIKFENEAEFQKWAALALDPNTACPVTGITNAEHQVKFGRRLVLDHDHQTGRPRRLIHVNINTTLGFLEAMTPEQITNLLRLHEEDRRTRDDHP